jgi:putative hydrolase of the HAD superfamily
LTEIRHIFFDVGGVLGTNGWDREERARATEHFRLDAKEFQCRHEEIVSAWEEGRITIEEYLENAVFYERRNFSRQEFVEFMYAQSHPDPDTIEITRELTTHERYTLMTLNNESDELNKYRIRAFGISEIFEAFLSSCWLGVRKPTQRFYENAIAIAQADPRTSVFIDDRQQNLNPARNLGMKVVLFQSASQLRAELGRILRHELSGA